MDPGGLRDLGVFEELTSQGGGRRLAVTDGEGSLHNSSCTLLIEMPKEINCYRKVLGAF